MQKDILKINDLSVSFQSGKEKVIAADRISFTLKKGCTTGIVGESGSGKSVTALAIMGLLPVPPAMITGQVSLLNEDGPSTALLSLPCRLMRHIRGNRISMIFQEPMSSLNPVMRCGPQVMEAILAHKDISRRQARARTIEIFSEVGLDKPEIFYHAYPHELSGGQKQRVMIAMAVSTGPEVLIADEPTTALDAAVQQTIIRLLEDLRDKLDLAILFITHDLGLISGIADELLVMSQGQVVESGKAKEIFQHPSHPYTRGLLSCRPQVDQSLRRLPTINDFVGMEKQTVQEALLNKLKRNESLYQKTLSEIYRKEPLLKTEKLSSWFPGNKRRGKRNLPVKVVADVTFNVFPGEVVGLVGPSGCGKTTLGRTILRLKEPSAGRIIFQNTDITHLSDKKLKKIRKEMQIVFQDPYSSLNPKITIGDAIMEPMHVHRIGRNQRERKEKAFDLLEKVGMERSHFYRYPHEFSGGQRQRICIARTLAMNPKFIICDESVSALDISIQAQVLNLLQDLKEELGLTYIFISHDMAVIRFMADRILEMNNGTIKEKSPV